MVLQLPKLLKKVLCFRYSLLNKVFFLIAVFLVNFVAGQVQPVLSSAKGPTLLPGGAADKQVGAKYIYRNVENSSDGFSMDAVLTILSIRGAQIVSVDSQLGVDSRFEPLIRIGRTGGWVDWGLEFVLAGTVNTATDIGSQAQVDSFTLEAIDVDGYEYFETFITNSYSLESPTSLTPEYPAHGLTIKFQSGRTSASNISVNNKEYIVRTNYSNVNTITFSTGRDCPWLVNCSAERQYSISFLGEVNFNNEQEIVVNTPPVAQDFLGNQLGVGAPLVVNVIETSSDAENNINPLETLLIDPNNHVNQGTVGNPMVLPGIGVYEVDEGGNVLFTPEPNFTGIANVEYQVVDDKLVHSNTATIGITVSGIDTDGDTVWDSIDVDDDNDGVLDTEEMNCPLSILPIRYPHNAQANTSGTSPGLVENNGVFMDITYQIQGNAIWHPNRPSIKIVKTPSNSYVVTESQNTDLYNGDVGVFTLEFNEPVYDVSFNLGRIGNSQGLYFEASENGVLKPVSITNNNIPDYQFHQTGQYVVSDISFGLGGSPEDNNIEINVEGSIDKLILYAGLTSPATNIREDITWYNFTYCTSIDTDNDSVFNHLDTDSDGDNCPDAVEASGSYFPSHLDSDFSLGNTSNTEGSPVLNETVVQQNSTAALLDNQTFEACMADLNLIKTVNKGVFIVGETVVFTLSLTNSGATEATGVQVKDLLPSGLSFDAGASSIPNQTTYSSATGVWDLSGMTLSIGTTVTLQIAATVNSTGIKLNTSEIIQSDQLDPDSTANNGN